MPAEDLTITAKWNINQYTLTIIFDNGNKDIVSTQDYGTAIKEVEDPTKVGHTFAGWDKEIPTTMPAKDLIITALWNVNEELLNFTFEYENDYSSIVITGVKDKSVTSVVVPNYVTSIAKGAFANCVDLASVTLPNNLTTIADEAFKDCHRLMSVIIPDSVTSIGKEAFYNCRSLAVVTVGEKVGSIGEDAFYLCDKVIEVFNKSNLGIIAGNSTYGKVASKALNVYTPSRGASNISEDANSCIIYTNGEDKILVAYKGNESQLVIANDITKIYKYAFRDNKQLTSITIPNSVKEIGDLALEHCSNLQTLVIGNGVTSLQKGLLKGCENLQSLTIPFVGSG
jgi:hypothetical protein